MKQFSGNQHMMENEDIWYTPSVDFSFSETVDVLILSNTLLYYNSACICIYIKIIKPENVY